MHPQQPHQPDPYGRPNPYGQAESYGQGASSGSQYQGGFLYPQPHAQQPYAQQPYAQQPHVQQPYPQQAPYGQPGPYGQGARPSGVTTMISAVLGAVVTLAWLAIMVTLIIEATFTAGIVFIVFTGVNAVLLGSGTVGLFLRKPFGRWVSLAGFILALPVSFLSSGGLFIIGTGDLAGVVMLSGPIPPIAGIVTVSLSATGRYLRAGGSPAAGAMPGYPY